MAGDTEDDDRTEEPTAKKLEKAIERGDVPKSMEINTWFIMGGMCLALLMLAVPVSQKMTLDLRSFLMNAHQVPPDITGFSVVGRKALTDTLTALALPFAVFMVAAIIGGFIQNRPLWTFEPLKPQLSRISPLSGFKRLVGAEAIVQFLKGLVKIGIVGAVSSYILWKEHDRLEGMSRLDNSALLPVILTLSLKLVGGVMAIFSVIALADLIYQRFSWMKRQRMTKREIKEEYKESDGNPEIKAKLRQIRSQRARKRMMAAVPQANVIITNPTHFAVALKYETGMPAPVCLAKGTDLIALKIRAIADENQIPIVENPPLARALHASVEIDEEIPVEHYKAVAEVIGYILRLRRRPA